MGGSEEGSSAQSEQSHQASHIYTYTCVMESYDLKHMEPTITELEEEERNGENAM